ncbi:MAG TPA: hypothetical protein VFZ87_07200 [Gemmatimonadales bacterium]
MRKFLLVVVSAAAISACSDSREERRVLSIDSTLDQPDLTLPDTVTRRDTSVAVATRSEPPAPAAKPAPKPEAPPAKPSVPAGPRRPVAAPRTAAADTSVQAYAPGRTQDSIPGPEPRVKPDSAASAERDTVAASADTTARARATRNSGPDTSRTLTRDTVRSQVDTTQVAARSPSPADTATTSPIETATPPVAATSPAPADTGSPTDTVSADTVSPDTAAAQSVARAPRPAGTTSTPPADTMVVSPSAAPPAEPSRSATELAGRTLPVGTEIHAQLDDSITSRRDTVGHSVSAHVMENVVGPNGRTLIPAGAQVRFTITRLRPSRSKSSQGRLGLRVDSIALNGQLETVQAETRPVPRELRGRGVTGEDAAKVGGGAAAGAVIGGVVGKTKGAVIGGVAGAAAGAVVATQTKTRDVVVKAKTPVVFILTAPLVAP